MSEEGGSEPGGSKVIGHLFELDRIRVGRLYDMVRDRQRVIADLAFKGIRTMEILGGGAVIALFTLLGHLDQLQPDLGLLWWSFRLFIAELVLVQLAVALGYLSQNALMRAEFVKAETSFHEAAGRRLDWTTKDESRGNRLLWGAIAAVVASIVLFAVGSGLALYAVQKGRVAAARPPQPLPPVVGEMACGAPSDGR